MLSHDVYSQPDVADPVLDERTVLGLTRRHGVRGAAVTGIDETGGEARVYGIDDRLVVKVQRPHRLRPRWPLGVPPADVASRALAALPASIELVALHSNPGPVHTFVRPETLEFVGLIDFGDAYIGHPALDWRWPTHEDHLDLLEGYGTDAPLTDEFMAAWRAGLVLSDMAALVTRPDRRPQALERLRDLVKTLA